MTSPGQGSPINSLATVSTLFWATLLIRIGRTERSPALVADGHHIMTDVVTSLGVVAGLVGAALTGWPSSIRLLAVIVALNILCQGWQVIGSSVEGLMDRAVDHDDHVRIRDIISANPEGRSRGA